jgi:DNA-binding NarL/FixJ family response regulator
MSDYGNLLVVEQHKGRAEEIAHDVVELFDTYFVATSVMETEFFIREYEIDFILINPFFTDGSGRQFVELLRKNTHLHSTPILIISRLPENRVKLDYYAYGADGYIQYPYEKDDLIKKIHRKLHSQKHIKEIADFSGDIIKGFHQRDEFERIFTQDSVRIGSEYKNGVLGLIAPVGIDAIMRDIGMDQGDHLMTALANLMREICSSSMNATAWSHKLIVFYTMDHNPSEIKQNMELLQERYLQKMQSAIGEQKPPGFRAVLSKIKPGVILDMQMRRLASQLINMDKHPEMPLSSRP